jgi:hypothetical protein
MSADVSTRRIETESEGAKAPLLDHRMLFASQSTNS